MTPRIASASVIPLCAHVAALALGALVGWPLQAQPTIPLQAQLIEIEQHLNARRAADAAGLLDTVIDRVQKGESLPSGASLERLILAAANAHFQTQNYSRAAVLADELEKLPGVLRAQIGEARMIKGLSLALQNQFAEAVPVFRSAEEFPDFRDKAMLYGAMSANQAGQIHVAIETYNRLLAVSPRDRDWADAALALIDLHLRAGNLNDARRGIALLRGNLNLVDNYAGLNILLLQLGDALLKAKDNAGALAAFRNITTRDALIVEQRKRIEAMERALARLRAIRQPSATDADAIRRINNRLEQAKASLEQLEKFVGYDAMLRYRLAFTFQERGGVWEAALLYEDLIANHPESAERENAFFGLVRAYADAGRFDKVGETVDRFTTAYPNSQFAPQALYLAAMSAGQRKDYEAQLRFLELATTRFPDSQFDETLRLTRAHTYFTLGRYAEAKQIAQDYAARHPKGTFIEDARYLSAMADLAEGRASESEAQIRAYLADFPEGRFLADARYRLAAAAYAKQDFAGCLELSQKWLDDFPADHPQRGEIFSLKADALAGLGRIEEAILAYHEAMNIGLSDEQLGYVLDELTRHYQSRKEFDAAVAMWEKFAADNPDHPYIINAAYWIGRIQNRQGKTQEALETVSHITRRFITDPSRTDVERLLVEMAASLARPPRVKRGEPKPEPIPEQQLFAQLERMLLVGADRSNPTARARVLFAQAEIASIRKNDALRNQLYQRIASNYAPDQLPPGILGKVGDAMLSLGQLDLARDFFQQIITAHPRSIFADYGYAGLGEIALREGDGQTALAQFNAAIDVAGARFKLKEATIGRARAQLLLGRPELAQALFEEVAANRSWRGEATAESLYYLGEIAAKRGTPDDLAKAQAHYQRIYLSYKRFPLWVARAYLRSAETFEKLGMPLEALTTINRMLTDRRLQEFPEWNQALAMKPRLEALVPAASAATAAPAPAPTS